VQNVIYVLLDNAQYARPAIPVRGRALIVVLLPLMCIQVHGWFFSSVGPHPGSHFISPTSS